MTAIVLCHELCRCGYALNNLQEAIVCQEALSEMSEDVEQACFCSTVLNDTK